MKAKTTEATAQPKAEQTESGNTSLVEKGASVKRKNKKVFIAYFYWLLGGVAGLHHFYLGRINQGFAYWTTGGGFLAAFIRDVWKIPEYVKQANLDPVFVKRLMIEMKQYKQPEFRGSRFLAMLTVSMFYGYLAQFSVPENCFGWKMNEHRFIWIIVVPVSIAFGNYLVGNIGYERISLHWALMGGFAPSLFLPLNPDMTSYCALFSTVLSYWKRSYRKSVIPKDPSLLKLVAVVLGIVFYTCLWGSMLYHNVSVVTKEGERIYLRDIVADYFDRESPNKNKTEDFSYWRILSEMRADLMKFLNEIKTQARSFRIMEDTQSYMILGLDWGASEDEIIARYRELAKKYHPDKHGGEDREKLAEYNSRMVDITRAYEALTKKRKRRARKAAAATTDNESSGNKRTDSAQSDGNNGQETKQETQYDILKDEL